MKLKLPLIAIAFLSAVATVSFAQSGTMAAALGTDRAKGVQKMDTFTVTGLVPPKDFKLERVSIGADRITFYVDGGFDGHGSMKFVSNSEGKLVDLVIYSSKSEVEAYNAHGFLISGSTVVDIDGKGKRSILVSQWEDFFRDQILTFGISFEKGRQKIDYAKDDLREFVGTSRDQQGNVLVVMRGVGSKELYSISEDRFAVLPREGTVFRLGVLDGKYYPVEEVKGTGGKVFAAVVVTEMTPPPW